jgi:hypothetical protein
MHINSINYGLSLNLDNCGENNNINNYLYGSYNLC